MKSYQLPSRGVVASGYYELEIVTGEGFGGSGAGSSVKDQT
jgi:hypothetical protein